MRNLLKKLFKWKSENAELKTAHTNRGQYTTPSVIRLQLSIAVSYESGVLHACGRLSLALSPLSR